MDARESVIRYLGQGGEIETRLKEKGSGEVEFLRSPRAFGFRDEDVLAFLYHLAAEGRVACSSIVHPFDSSEYILKWRWAV